jgi:hypothetical protein
MYRSTAISMITTFVVEVEVDLMATLRRDYIALWVVSMKGVWVLPRSSGRPVPALQRLSVGWLARGFLI